MVNWFVCLHHCVKKEQLSVINHHIIQFSNDTLIGYSRHEWVGKAGERVFAVDVILIVKAGSEHGYTAVRLFKTLETTNLIVATSKR